MSMQRWLGWALLWGAICLLPANDQAQYQSPYSPGPCSPYLNLLRGGGSLTSNYYGLVRPQLDFQQGITQLQRQVQYGQQNALVQTIDTGVVTGLYAGFQTQGAYFRGAYFHPFGVVNTGLPGQSASGQPRAGMPGLNTPGFYSTPSTAYPNLPASSTTKPPGQ